MSRAGVRAPGLRLVLGVDVSLSWKAEAINHREVAF